MDYCLLPSIYVKQLELKIHSDVFLDVCLILITVQEVILIHAAHPCPIPRAAITWWHPLSRQIPTVPPTKRGPSNQNRSSLSLRRTSTRNPPVQPIRVVTHRPLVRFQPSHNLTWKRWIRVNPGITKTPIAGTDMSVALLFAYAFSFISCSHSCLLL